MQLPAKHTSLMEMGPDAFVIPADDFVPVTVDCPPSPPASTGLALSAHNASSRPSKRYPCKFSGCDKDFSTSGHLSRHSRIHWQTKRYTCGVPMCDRTFHRADNALQHEKSHRKRLADEKGDAGSKSPSDRAHVTQVSEALLSPRPSPTHSYQDLEPLERLAELAADLSFRMQSPPAPVSPSLIKTSISFLID
ncbi:hypothetical protein BC830DRAFT_1081430 [Chytriomyces sp. MP71]|nr:hypothetical protein BC830DRAFT_1081430 [Chytriomyces sp. MP71]